MGLYPRVMRVLRIVVFYTFEQENRGCLFLCFLVQRCFL